MQYGLTSQQDINAEEFNMTFSTLPGCQVYFLLPKSAIQILPAALFCFVKHDKELHFFPKRDSSFAAAMLGLLHPSWHPFPPMLLYLPGKRALMGIFWTAWNWQSWSCKTSSTIFWHRFIACPGKTWTKEGKDWLLIVWELILAQKSLTGSEKQLSSHGEGRDIRMPPTRIYTYNWLPTALWHPSGEKWRAEEGQGDTSYFQLGSWSCPLLVVLSCTFFLLFSVGRVDFLSWCLLQDHCAS